MSFPSHTVIAGAVLAVALAAASLTMPLIAVAQSSAEASAGDAASLSATIRTAILNDPRARSMSSAQIDALVQSLSAQAQSQGVTAQAIAYRPGAFVSVASSSGSCTDISSALCGLGKLLGYDSTDKAVPIFLWSASLVLLIIVWLIRRRHRLAAAFALQKPPATGPLG